MEKIKEIIKKILKKEVILYICFGILTTIINLGAFYIMNDILEWNSDVSNFIAIILAVLVAYITNKDLVFHSEAKSIKEKWSEFLKFIQGRSFTMIIEYLGGMLLFQLPIPKTLTKLFLIIIVIILNFFVSKFYAFKSKGKEQENNEK